MQSQELTSASANACTNACTNSAEREHAAGSDAGGAGTGAALLADVLRMLDRLPLTDAERAETVRRLLANRVANPEG
ncbi:MAG: hypothetical protein HZB38_02795 [Planctomycetes bacterium]|nr:hypothetical protein [Planctomycetota bacterium]